ncbi:cell envelope integrity protein TolA [Shewanella surugensis]|uniref:Cell envelope integrity protein TolA n=1 Tax=Shewanella surugensis TaxID=212020 RepID=A0ABT0LFC3_9GAMM|nr:cell envelope integrity protein TolA [Shewanella surugensis]MCL1126393.1 cell envelope integrity protein TolA [Shewanella surugensis]
MAKKSKLSIPISISAGIHIGVIALLALNLDFVDKPEVIPQVSAPALRAVIIDQSKVTQQVEKLKAQKLAAQRKEKSRLEELERQADQARKDRKQEQLKIKKLEQQRQQKEKETEQALAAAKAAKLKQQQALEKAQQAETQRKQKEKERQVAEAAAQQAVEKRKQEEVAAKKVADERKRKAAAERKRQAEENARREQEQMMQDALEKEQASLSSLKNKQLVSEVNKYRAMIKATIERNLITNESMRGKSCKVFVRLAKDGFVTAVKTLSGDNVVCRAAKTAITKAGRLPVSAEPDVYEKLREINLTVSPDKFN